MLRFNGTNAREGAPDGWTVRIEVNPKHNGERFFLVWTDFARDPEPKVVAEKMVTALQRRFPYVWAWLFSKRRTYSHPMVGPMLTPGRAKFLKMELPAERVKAEIDKCLSKISINGKRVKPKPKPSKKSPKRRASK